jgi:hypothetical protein
MTRLLSTQSFLKAERAKGLSETSVQPHEIEDQNRVA